MKRPPEPVKPPPLDQFEIEWWDVERPTEVGEADPKVHTAASIEKLAEAVRRIGPQVALVVDPNGVIIKGRRTRAAYRLAGMRQVPVKVVRGIPQPELDAWRLFDNRSAQDDGWDEGLLGIRLQQLREEGVPLAHTGFEDDEIDRILGDTEDLKPMHVRPLPSMTWVLIGCPTVRFHEIADLVTDVQLKEGVVCEMTANDKQPKIEKG